MNKKILFYIGLFCFLFSAHQGKAQVDSSLFALKPDSAVIDTSWKKGLLFNVNIGQVYLKDWAAGGVPSISINSLFSSYINYKKDKTTWDNTLDLAYGTISLDNKPWRKNDDRIELNSKYGYKLAGDWYYSALLNFRTQFSPGYDYTNEDNPVAISDFMAPAYLTGGIGFDYKPDNDFTVFISPVTAKITYVGWQKLADAGAYGVTPAEFDTAGMLIKKGKVVRYEVGAFVKCYWKKELSKNVSFKTNLALFSNYLDRPQNIDVNFDFLLNIKFAKYFSASVTFNMIYDHDINVQQYGPVDAVTGIKPVIGQGPRLQIKEVFGLGFSYKI